MSEAVPCLNAKLALDQSPLEKAQKAKEGVQRLFQKAQQITQFKEVLCLYSSISLSKASSLLKMESSVITALIAEYSQKEEQKEKASVWEESVVKRLPCLNSDLRIEFTGE